MELVFTLLDKAPVKLSHPTSDPVLPLPESGDIDRIVTAEGDLAYLLAIGIVRRVAGQGGGAGVADNDTKEAIAGRTIGRISEAGHRQEILTCQRSREGRGVTQKVALQRHVPKPRGIAHGAAYGFGPIGAGVDGQVQDIV